MGTENSGRTEQASQRKSVLAGAIVFTRQATQKPSKSGNFSVGGSLGAGEGLGGGVSGAGGEVVRPVIVGWATGGTVISFGPGSGVTVGRTGTAVREGGGNGFTGTGSTFAGTNFGGKEGCVGGEMFFGAGIGWSSGLDEVASFRPEGKKSPKPRRPRTTRQRIMKGVIWFKGGFLYGYAQSWPHDPRRPPKKGWPYREIPFDPRCRRGRQSGFPRR